jgi:biotin transport system substrate-specific component
MKNIFLHLDTYKQELEWVKGVLFGTLMITLGSLARISLYPVSFTLQTFSLFLLALTQSPKQAFASAAFYLFLASAGMPVLGGKINLLWFAGKAAGYLFAFPIAAFLMAWIHQKGSPIVALFVGQMVIFTLGWIWLIPFLGAKTAFIKGVLIFLPSEVIKAVFALVFVRRRSR